VRPGSDHKVCEEVTFRVQFAPVPTLALHVLLWSKSAALVPIIVMPLTDGCEAARVGQRLDLWAARGSDYRHSKGQARR